MVRTSFLRPPAPLARAIAFVLAASAGVHCSARTPLRDRGRTSAASDAAAGAGYRAEFVDQRVVQALDLLLVVDNSISMRENQANIMAQFEPMLRQLVAPPCVSAANPVPHACDPRDPNDRPRHLAVRDLHVGVISTDLGTRGSRVEGCANSDLGDDGLLNPIRYGQALREHLPFSAPAGFRPADCTDPNQFPSFLSFDSTMAGDPAAVTRLAHDFRCNAGLYVGGCGLEQQLESVWRALIWHDASARPGNADPNAGFVRDDALLSILMLTDEEDGSVRDCRFARGAPCDDATSVFDSAATRWASTNLNLRFYLYRPGSLQDPTWPLDRYINPADAAAGFLALKPGHPERVLFGAITGVPLEVPRRPDGTTDWDALLGAPAAGSRDDFASRDSATAIDTMSREGPVSMRQANADPTCPERVVPACRREGTSYDPARPTCTTTEQYFAWPARRITEVARRFDESRLCNGQPCRNGVVTSICSNNYGPLIEPVLERVQNQAPSRRCIEVPLRQVTDAAGRNTVDCVVRELLPVGDRCAGRAELSAVLGADGQPTTEPTPEGPRALCEVRQVPTDASGRPDPTSGVTAGWYYDSSRAVCDQRVSFTTGAAPPFGTTVRIQCSPSANR